MNRKCSDCKHCIDWSAIDIFYMCKIFKELVDLDKDACDCDEFKRTK